MGRLASNADFSNWMGFLAQRWNELYAEGKKTQHEEYWFRLDELDKTMNLAKELIAKGRQRVEEDDHFPTKELETGEGQ